MIPNPIRKVLSTLSTHEVQYLLMGGQACVLYGAAEFSRDCDIAILCNAKNLSRLDAALRELKAERIAVPPFEPDYLQRGHAVHFRCQASDAVDIRIDVMAKMRNVAPFDDLWQRRATLADDAGLQIEIMSIGDLVLAKKTQRDKDWPMIRRLIEADFAAKGDTANEDQIRFWLREARTPSLLTQLSSQHHAIAMNLCESRPLLQSAIARDQDSLESRLIEEQEAERKVDRAYWRPLKQELEELRHKRL